MNMKTKNSIAYYCFNRACKGSVYFSNTVRITDLPLTLATLSQDHECSLCHSRLVSMMDIELRQAAYQPRVTVVHASYASRHIYQ